MKDNTLPLKGEHGLSGIVDHTVERIRCDHLTEQDIKDSKGVAFAVQNNEGTRTYVMGHMCGIDTPCTGIFLEHVAKAIEPVFDKVRIVVLKSGSWTLVRHYDKEELK